MKFDAVVGNPPYQEETAKHQSLTNGQARSKSVFQYFQMAADSISEGAVSLIYPGARWIHRSGKGMSAFGLDQINDTTLERLDFYPDSQEIFADVAIADGISIVYKNKRLFSNQGFKYIYHRNGTKISVFYDYPGDRLISLNPNDGSVIEKIESFVKRNGLGYIHDRVLSQKLFGIESSFVEDNPSSVRLLTNDSIIDYATEIKLLTNDKAGKAGRATWFIANRSDITCGQSYIDEWQVVVSSANAGGQKRDNQIEVVDNHSAFGRSRVALASFKTEKEAKNFFQYARTALIRFMFLMTDESLTSLGKKVPDIMDYSDSSTLVSFDSDLNQQLYKLAGLSAEEIAYIEATVNAKGTTANDDKAEKEGANAPAYNG